MLGAPRPQLSEPQVGLCQTSGSFVAAPIIGECSRRQRRGHGEEAQKLRRDAQALEARR